MRKLRIKDIELDYWLKTYGCKTQNQLAGFLRVTKNRKLVVRNTEKATKRRQAMFGVISLFLTVIFAPIYFTGCLLAFIARLQLAVAYLLTAQTDKAWRVVKELFTTNPLIYTL